MAKLSIVAGATSQSVNVFIQDSSSTVGAGLTGLAFNTASLTAYYTFTGTNTAATAITLATLAAANSAYSSGGFIAIDGTNMPGLYRLDLPNAALATSKGRAVTVMLKGATNMAPCVLEIELTGWDNQDAVHGGMSALPNTACTSNASLITSGSGTDQLTVSGGIASADAKKINAVSTASVTTINANQGTTQPLNFTGTGASALVKSDMTDIAGAAVSTTSAQIGVNVVNINSVAAATPGASGGLLISGSNAGTTTFGALTVTGNTTLSDGLIVNRSTLNASAIVATGNGTGHGASFTSGAGATGDGIRSAAGSTNGNGLTLVHAGTGSDFNATSTPLTLAKTTNITGFNDIAASAIVSNGAITTSSGKVSEVALVDTLTTYTGNTPQTGDAFARLGAPAGASVSADIASVQTDTTNLKTRLPSALTGAGNMKSDALAINGSTTGAINLAIGAAAIVQGTASGTPTTTNIPTSSLTPAASVAGQFIGRLLIFDANTTTAALQGQGSTITGSTNTGVLTVNALTTAPVSGDTFAIY